MDTELSIDSKLLDEAFNLSGLTSKQETVNQALKEYVQRRKQRQVIELFGNFAAENDYNYRKGRAWTIDSA